MKKEAESITAAFVKELKSGGEKALGKKGSSGRWLQEHKTDEYVVRAQREGYRCRAVYKLKELLEDGSLLTTGERVLDLGAAPGGWCEVVSQVVGPTGQVVAVDLLEIEPLEGVTFIQGDFREDDVLQQIKQSLSGPVRLVMSDMAPNISGIRSVDQSRCMYLAELALDCASQVLSPGGHFITKLFHGESFDSYVKTARGMFQSVKVRKPRSSRSRSRETYMVARGYEV